MLNTKFIRAEVRSKGELINHKSSESYVRSGEYKNIKILINCHNPTNNTTNYWTSNCIILLLGLKRLTQPTWGSCMCNVI